MRPRDHAGGPGEEDARAHACAPVLTLPPADVEALCRDVSNRLLFLNLDGNPWASAFIAQRVERWLLDNAERIGSPAIRELARRLDPAQPREGSST